MSSSGPPRIGFHSSMMPTTSPPTTRTQALQPLLCAVWTASLASTAFWQCIAIGSNVTDLTCICVAHIVVLPVVLLCAKIPSLLPMLGISIVSICMGMLLIDASFDVQVRQRNQIPTSHVAQWHAAVYDASQVIFAEDSTRLDTLRSARGFYHTMLNAPIVNGALLVCLLCMSFGAWIGAVDALSTDDVEIRRTWTILVGIALSGIPLYILMVIPRYLSLRASAVFDAAVFDNWWRVLAARAVLMASLAGANACCMRLILQREGRPKTHNHAKVEGKRLVNGETTHVDLKPSRGRTRSPARKAS